jgi:hypothetical protein
VYHSRGVDHAGLAVTEEFFSLVPQMRDYLGESNVYVPYLMHFQAPNIRKASFSTDEFGFRRTHGVDGYLTLQGFNSIAPEARPCALLGNSTAFGVGASSDERTIASRLNQLGYGTWFNFSGRTFNPLQEVLSFLTFVQNRVDTAIVLTGINLFDMSYRFAANAHEWLPPFYSERIFFDRLSPSSLRTVRSWIGRQWVWLRKGFAPAPFQFVSGALLKSLQRGLADADMLLADPKHRERAIRHFDHALHILHALQPGKINRLIVAIQPVPEWFGRPLTSQERKLSNLVDQYRGPKWRLIHGHLLRHADAFKTDLVAVCHKQGVECVDLNTANDLLASDWVFIDRYHLTDGAQRTISEILHAQIVNGQSGAGSSSNTSRTEPLGLSNTASLDRH